MKTIRLVALALAALAAALLGQGQHSALADGEYGTLYIDVLPDANNTTQAFGPIEVCRDTEDIGDGYGDDDGLLEIGERFSIDVVVEGLPATYPAAYGAYYRLNYNPVTLEVVAYDWESWKFGADGLNISDPMPDTNGIFITSYTNPPAVSGDGVLQRITLEAVGNGTSDLTLTDAQVADELGGDHSPPEVLVHDPPGTVRVVVGGFCPFPVGGVAELPDIPDSPSPNYMALAGLGAAALVVVSAGAWYARRRWLR